MRPECRSCGAPIVWALTRAGRNMPLDFDPSTTPTSLRAWRDPHGRLQVRDIDGAGSTEIPTDARHATSHWATCPNAAQHRKPKRREPEQCRTVEVDGIPVLVRGRGTPTQEDLDALTEVVQAAKRRLDHEGQP